MKRNSKMFLFIVMLLLTGSSCFLMTSCQKDYDVNWKSSVTN